MLSSRTVVYEVQGDQVLGKHNVHHNVSNDMPHNFLVKRRWADSVELIIPTVCGDQTTLEYSRIGRTYVMKALTSSHAAESNEQ